jgi:hypothetical protein
MYMLRYMKRLYRPKEEHILQYKCGQRIGWHVRANCACLFSSAPSLGKPIDAMSGMDRSFLSYQRKNTANHVQAGHLQDFETFGLGKLLISVETELFFQRSTKKESCLLWKESYRISY